MTGNEGIGCQSSDIGTYEIEPWVLTDLVSHAPKTAATQIRSSILFTRASF